jgi:class 3 adenylate cyclase/tetratricopeptide (TPR) repeat protein
MSEGPRRERKVITVVLADLVGFTARAERLDPEDVEALLGPYHAHLRQEFERFGGTVEKFIGDAVAAIFGAPIAHEDDPERAVRAALSIRDTIRERGELEVRIGINTGEAIVRLDLASGSGEGYATGDVLNTASRLQAGAPVNGILAGAATFSATRDVIRYEPVEPVVAKGKAEPVPAWEAVEARSRFGVDVRQTSAIPLVGRQRERALLVETLDRAESEATPQLVTIVGVPGIGKSRLVYELFEEIDARPELRTWRQGRSLPYGEGISFWALGEMVKAEAGILEGDEPAAAADKLERAVREVVRDDEADWVVGWLRPLVGLETEREMGRERTSESFTAWRRFFEGLAERRPLVLVFEDLHWADDGLLDFVDHLVDWASGVPILVLCTTRPELLERRPGWGGGKRNALTLALSPLSDPDAARVLASVLGDATLPAAIQEALLERASGNPLYAQQFARLFLERGSTGDFPLPENVQGLIAARLDALSRDEKSLLQDAAVMGKVFWSGALSSGRTPAILQGLQRKEFIRRERRASVATEDEFAFCHVLVRDVAYSQIPRAERAAKHRRAAGWIESLGRPQDHAELLAHHYSAAVELALGEPDPDLVERARRAWRDAGDRAFSLNSVNVAVSAFSRALEMTPAGTPDYAKLLFRLAVAENRATGTAEERLTEAASALLEQGDREGAAEAELLVVRVAWERGDREGWMRHLERAVGLVVDEGPSATRALILANQARFLFLGGEAGSLEAGQEALAMAESLGLDDVRAHALNTIGLARHARGDDGGLDDLRESIAITTAINSSDSMKGWNNLAGLLSIDGRLDESERAEIEVDRVAQHFGSAADVRWHRISYTFQPYRHGDWDESLRQIDEHIAEIEGGRPHYLESSLRFGRAVIRVGRGDLDGALDDAMTGLVQARRSGDPQLLFPALVLAVLVQVERGEIDEANATLTELLKIRRAAPAALPFAGPAVLVDAAVRLGRGREFLDVVAMGRPTPWLEAAEAMVAGDWLAAAAVYERMASWPDEALARLRAAQQLAGDGRRAEARVEADRALGYFRRARATAYVVEAEELSLEPPRGEDEPAGDQVIG